MAFMTSSVRRGHVWLNPRKELREGHVEAVDEQRERGQRRDGMTTLHGRHEGPRHRGGKGRLGQPRCDPPAAQLEPDRAREGGIAAATAMFMNS